MKIIIALLLIMFTGCKKDPADVSDKISESRSTTENSDPGTDKSKAGNISANDNKPIGYVQYAISKLPVEIKYQGSVIAMAKWKDKLGENIVFVTETAENSNEDTRSKELFAYHYAKNDNGTEQLWKINDFVKDCPVDLTLNYIDKTLEITDLDSNGIAESSLIYRMGCKGDVSSDDMKFIMHEGKEKYAIRGIMDITLNGKPFQKGEMNIDPAYNNAPAVFLEYSKDKWDEYKVDKLGE